MVFRPNNQRPEIVPVNLEPEGQEALIKRIGVGIVHVDLADVGRTTWGLTKGIGRVCRGLVLGAAKGIIADVGHHDLVVMDEETQP